MVAKPQSAMAAGQVTRVSNFPIWFVKVLTTGMGSLARLMAIGCLSALATHALPRAEIRRPIAEADVAQLSAPYRTALGLSRGFPAAVQVAFLDEERLVVAS